MCNVDRCALQLATRFQRRVQVSESVRQGAVAAETKVRRELIGMSCIQSAPGRGCCGGAGVPDVRPGLPLRGRAGGGDPRAAVVRVLRQGAAVLLDPEASPEGVSGAAPMPPRPCPLSAPGPASFHRPVRRAIHRFAFVYREHPHVKNASKQRPLAGWLARSLDLVYMTDGGGRAVAERFECVCFLLASPLPAPAVGRS